MSVTATPHGIGNASYDGQKRQMTAMNYVNEATEYTMTATNHDVIFIAFVAVYITDYSVAIGPSKTPLYSMQVCTRTCNKI